MKRHAFTLIELLVVIAIIAILAAILFPVFAQAKAAAKKAASISNIKQSATCIAIYTADHDDSFPSAYAKINNGTTEGYWWGYGATYPNGWAQDGFYVAAEDAIQWANTTEPYRKNGGVLEAAGMAVERPPTFATPLAGGPARKRASWAFNGLLHYANGSVIGAPSTVTMFWAGHGAAIHDGVAYSTPYLVCSNQNVACRFNSSTGPQGETTFNIYGRAMWYTDGGGDFSYWLYAKGSPFVHADTSVKMRRHGSPTISIANNNPFGDPFATYDSVGIEWSYYYCYAPGASSGPAYICFFRPDRDAYGQ